MPSTPSEVYSESKGRHRKIATTKSGDFKKDDFYQSHYNKEIKSDSQRMAGPAEFSDRCEAKKSVEQERQSISECLHQSVTVIKQGSRIPHSEEIARYHRRDTSEMPDKLKLPKQGMSNDQIDNEETRFNQDFNGNIPGVLTATDIQKVVDAMKIQPVHIDRLGRQKDYVYAECASSGQFYCYTRSLKRRQLLEGKSHKDVLGLPQRENVGAYFGRNYHAIDV